MIKSLSPKMEEVLMDCHERKILNLKPRSTYYSRYCKLLLEKGYLIAKPFIDDNKFMMAFFITPAGVKYLEALQEL